MTGLGIYELVITGVPYAPAPYSGLGSLSFLRGFDYNNSLKVDSDFYSFLMTSYETEFYCLSGLASIVASFSYF